MNVDEVVTNFLKAVADGTFELPQPGNGETTRRLDALFDAGRHDLSYARLVEAHTDALAILHEAEHPVPSGAALGVWAAEGPGSRLTAERTGDRVRLTGAKRWCSGAGIVTHALVTARDGDAELLVLLPLDLLGVTVHDDGWVSPAFAVTRTDRIEVDVELPATAVVGPEGFYLARPGFWYGAVGVAACWAGGIAGLLEPLEARGRDDAHERVAVGRARAEVWNLRAILRSAAERIDSGDLDASPDGRTALALTVRHLVDRSADEVVRVVTRALGPGPMAHDPQLARRLAELQLYVRQSHAERDLAALGSLPRPPDGASGVMS